MKNRIISITIILVIIIAIWVIKYKLNGSSIAIIGGADGPTAIYFAE